MKDFIGINWFMFRVSLVLSLTYFILSGFDFVAFGLIFLVMFMSLITSILFWQNDDEAKK